MVISHFTTDFCKTLEIYGDYNQYSRYSFILMVTHHQIVILTLCCVNIAA